MDTSGTQCTTVPTPAAHRARAAVTGGADVPGASRVVVDGVSFDAVTEVQVVDRIVGSLRAERGGMLLTPNVDILRQLRRPSLQAIAQEADIVVADGMPIVWASRLQKAPLPERVTGASLAQSLPAAAAKEGFSVYLLGGEEGVAEQAAFRLTRDVDGLEVKGWHCPPHGFERDEQEIDAMVSGLRAAQPDLVLVGLGFPKQERLIKVLRSTLPTAWFVGCGGALAFLAGRVPRAPQFLQGSGLEWTHRLVKEPRRMARRYLVDDIPYALGLLGRAAREGTGPRQPSA